jgi:XTP/dITP diphosphohydrolase
MIKDYKQELLIATGNPGKIREIEESLRGLQITPRYLKDFDLFPVAETGETYEDNAVLKATGYAKQTGIWALADDSGLEVDALGGLPGVRSARFAGNAASDLDRTSKLLKAMARTQQERTARFICCMALARGSLNPDAQNDADPELLYVCEGRCEGEIGFEPRGRNGFGYDPIFIPMGYDMTFGQLPASVKNVISHRAKALTAIREFLICRERTGS